MLLNWKIVNKKLTVKLTRNAIKRKFIGNDYRKGFDRVWYRNFGNSFSRIISIFSMDRGSLRNFENRKNIFFSITWRTK